MSVVHIGFVPYLNMAPFHQGFGPEPMRSGPAEIRFQMCVPRALGQLAEAGSLDAGAMSWVDAQRLSSEFEVLQPFGIGAKREAQSVLLFSKRPIAEFSGTCAVTEETSTSYRLLQTLLRLRYERRAVEYHRIGSLGLYDGSSDGVLLIGDDALRAARLGVKGLPVVTDLGEEWFRWQERPFVFARWVVRRSLPYEVKAWIATQLNESLHRTEAGVRALAAKEAEKRELAAETIERYWNGFDYRLTTDYEQSMNTFEELSACVTT